MAMAFIEVVFFGESMIGNPGHLCKLYLMLCIVLLAVRIGAGLKTVLLSVLTSQCCQRGFLTELFLCIA